MALVIEKAASEVSMTAASKPAESSFGRAYRVVYSALCGTHPDIMPWHFQWLSGKYLHDDLRGLLSTLSGRILDAGCGDKPYEGYFSKATEYVGLDIFFGPNVDIVVRPSERWPLPTGYYDVVFSSQALEHVEDLELTMSEMKRVLRVGGSMVLSFPFIYNEHGAPHDFHRFTVHRAVRLFPGFEVVNVKRQGGLGSTIGILVLNWIDISLNQTKVGRFLRAPLLPVWLLFSLVTNVLGMAVDFLDRTDAFYSNVVIVLRKKTS
jgi:SAM-dependent methyltransferase